MNNFMRFGILAAQAGIVGYLVHQHSYGFASALFTVYMLTQLEVLKDKEST
jgi:hypothetical protein